jgi:DNA-binding NarL/FixJ family response regulator
MMPDVIRVFHLEDYKILRDGVKLLLSQDRQIAVVGGAQRGDQLFRLMDGVAIDVLLLDIFLDSMEDMETADGFEICRRVKKLSPRIRVLAHSVYDDADRVARIIKAGALGFVSKKAGYEELIQGIKVVAAGKKYVCKETAGKLKNLNEFLLGMEDTLQGSNEVFSRREKEVLELLAGGFSSRAIAGTLGITERTVESHRKNLVVKAGVRNTSELIAFASMRGIIKK